MRNNLRLHYAKSAEFIWCSKSVVQGNITQDTDFKDTKQLIVALCQKGLDNGLNIKGGKAHT